MQPDPSAMARAPRHGLPPRHFNALAGGGGGAAAIAHLWDAERSYRLVLLDLLVSLAAERSDATGPLVRPERAWELLVGAERQSSAVTDGMLLLPETGVWLMHTLRRLRDAGHPPEGEVPLWVDTGYLHLIAASAAIRTGLDFSLCVPARSGAVWFPSLGSAMLPGLPRWQAVEATFDDRTLTVRYGREAVRVPDPPGRVADGWRPSRKLSLDLAEGPKEIFLNDVGPYRIIPPEPPSSPDATPPEQADDRWAALLRRAWALLSRADPQSAEDVAACLRTIEALPAPEPFRWHSATSADGMGGMAASEPTGSEPLAAAQFAAVLAHEIQHSKLGALMHMYSLHTQEIEPRLYAPWRDDPRPLRGMLQGVYAFTAVARFWRGYVLSGSAPEGEIALARFEFALRRRQLLSVLRPLCRDAELTSLGRRVVEQLTETVARWEDDPVPVSILSDAEQAADDHAVSWRLYHLVPDPTLVTKMVNDWLTRRRTDGPQSVSLSLRDYPAPHLVPDPTARNLDSRAILMRVRLMDPALKKRRDMPNNIAAVVRGARPADFLLVTNDTSAALDCYVAEIIARRGPRPGEGTVSRSAAGAWAGLRLALEGMHGHQAAAWSLLHQPELVRDVHHAIRKATGDPVDPVAVAEWVGLTVGVPG